MAGDVEFTEGGDPVCWLDRVCEECGAFREDPSAAACARCGTRSPGAEAQVPAGGAESGQAAAGSPAP